MKETYENVLPWYLAQLEAGHRAALATLVRADGSSPRPVGSQIAVTQDGRHFGYITGGCAEAAIHDEAVQVIRTGTPRLLRYGEGSAFMDIQLPCGAGIDVLISSPTLSAIEEVLSGLSARQPVALNLLGDADTAPKMRGFTQDPAPDETWVKNYTPAPALQIIGRGPIVAALATLAATADFEVHVATPDTDISDASFPATAVDHMTTPERYSPAFTDQWSAGVLLFHDHEWEPPTLLKLIRTDCFYLAALGSQKTHAQRCEQLRGMGVEEKQLARISGPAGLDIGARTPQEIAVSILAEVIAAFRKSEPVKGA